MPQQILLPVSLAAMLAGAGPSAAHHDDIADPPPLSVSQQLPAGLILAPATISVSGFSAGGFFANQFHIAYSATVTGAAVLAGGPYGCVDIIKNPYWPFGKLDRTSAAVVACTNYLGDHFWGLRHRPPAAADAQQLIADSFRSGEINDSANLADDRVWLFRGDLDAVVPAAVADSLADLYRILGVDGEALHVEPGDTERLANHGMPVDSLVGESRFPPRDCAAYAVPFVIECGYDAPSFCCGIYILRTS